MSLSLRLAFGIGRNQFWRRLSLLVAGIICASTGLLGVSVANMLSMVDSREFARTGVIGDSSKAGLYVVRRADTWADDQFPVVYLEPGRDGKLILPPGVESMPNPGEAVLSPRLAELARTHDELSYYRRGSMIIGQDGLIRPDELLAYVRPPADKELASAPPAHAVQRFGGEPNSSGTASVSPPLELPTIQMVLGAITLLGIPVLLLICAATATASSTRDQRLQVLRWLGLSGRHTVLVVVVDAIIWTGLGAVLGALASWICLTYATHLPILGVPVFAGDLTVGAGAVASSVLATMLLAGLSATLTDRWRHGTNTPRPSATAGRLSRFRLIPASVGSLLILGSLVVPGRAGGSLALGGAVTVVLAIPLLMPYWIASSGGLLRLGGSTAMLLAGRRLERRPTEAARPLFGIAGLALIACVVLGFLAVVTHEEPAPHQDSSIVAYRVSFLSDDGEGARHLQRSLPNSIVASYSEQGDELVVAAECRRLQEVLDLACKSEASRLSEADTAQLQRAAGIRSGGAVRLVDALPKVNGRILAVGRAESLPSSAVHEAANAVLLAPVVSSVDDHRQRPSPLVPWLLSTLAVAAAIAQWRFLSP